MGKIIAGLVLCFGVLLLVRPQFVWRLVVRRDPKPGTYVGTMTLLGHLRAWGFVVAVISLSALWQQ